MPQKKKTPVELTIYGTDDDVLKELSRLIVPWGLLKKAAKLQQIEQENLEAADIDEITDLVLEIFEGQVTREELEKGADLGDMLTVIMSIVMRAKGLVPNEPPRT